MFHDPTGCPGSFVPTAQPASEGSEGMKEALRLVAERRTEFRLNPDNKRRKEQKVQRG